MRVNHFSDIETDFISRVHTMVWCNAATIDEKQRPRSRILHPIWEGSTGWIGTHRNSYKAQHLAHNPHMSLAYIADITKPVYIDARVEWVDEMETKQRIWDLFKYTPEPLGYDPALSFIRVDHEHFGLLKVIPWRIDLLTFPSASMDEGTRVWYSKAEKLEA
jgi:general stress protein 26